MKKLISTTFLVLFLISTFSCDENSINPIEEQPGRRDYNWNIDTVVNPTYYPGKTLYRMWGSSPSDVWCIGMGGDLNQIFHYDGQQWKSVEYQIPYGLYSIYGFAQNNIYIGAQNRIYKFDGNSWKESVVLTKDGHDWDIVLDNMWGISPNDFYAFGAYPDENGYANNSVIAHYTGNWSLFDTDGLRGIVEKLYKTTDDEKIYLRTVQIGGGKYFDSTLIYEFSQGKYTKIYGSIEGQGTQADISLINNEMYFVLGTNLERIVDNRLQVFLKVDNANFYQRIWGRNSKDIFLMMTDGVAHYNGVDIEYLFHSKSKILIGGAALFTSDVFFLIYELETGLSLVYHGKLSN